jgi:uncharacterized protein
LSHAAAGGAPAQQELTIPLGDGAHAGAAAGGGAAAEAAALLLLPPAARWLLVLGHGAGAGMRHAFMQSIAERLAARAVATLRYEYPYMTKGSRRPDPAPRLEAVTRAAVGFAAAHWPALRIAAGGKSLGGRMTSRAHAAAPLPRVAGIVFFGFPLHPAGAPGVERAAHLSAVQVPLLFLQGTRDRLATPELIRDVSARLEPRATLHFVAGADHGFNVLRRSGRTDDEVLDELADTTCAWLTDLEE